MPPITKFTLYTPFIIFLIDSILFPILHFRFNFSHWSYLDFDNSVLKLQIFRFIIYPFSTSSLLELLIIPLWLIPEMYKLEKKQGSLKFLWTLLLIFTILPGIAFVFIMKIITIDWFNNGRTQIGFSCHGMTGWVVGLIFWSYLIEDESEQQDRMYGRIVIAGAIRIPKKYWPIFVFVFFVFLVPGIPILLNISASIMALLYVKGKFEFLMPSNEKFIEYEEKTWLRFLTNASNYVSINSAGSGGYLPLFMPATPTTNTATHPNPSTANSSANTDRFPGQGIRLGF
ncbi:uncharacterized protein BX663DRAFT_487396 [Cokeromyces recurvatus]|uniref:uncharacterized protein n=1 Tax=Cokeromyces recurvatus TaxID=90255 RepID=UPI00221E6B1D|nr:uncharacterized protein BX663DRAFT_487396 [Cokeromyces recurvatus]KAI7901685.1 hypothetical protein BX663DRAFT_487396 [Cokeromyces recurvatus]